MPDAHFELRLPDGSIKLRSDNTVMQFKPSAYMAIEVAETLVFVRDCRQHPRLQFTGGGIEIGIETPQDAAVREAFEEIGAAVSKCSFVGQFETYEPVHLFKAQEWTTPTGEFVKQLGEVSEIVNIPLQELYSPIERLEWQVQFYPAQWKMLGWYLLLPFRKEMFPVFSLWSEDPWNILDRSVKTTKL